MKCCQCNRPAIFLIGDENIPLCLECNLKFVQMTTMQNEMLERQINYYSDLMDCTVGFGPSGPKFPERKTVNLGGVALHNIKVDNSTIGFINTGNIETVDVALSALTNSGNNDIAIALNQLTTEVVKTSELQNDVKCVAALVQRLWPDYANAPDS
jgi:hypothetical protein